MIAEQKLLLFRTIALASKQGVMNALSWPSVVSLEITSRCNNACPGCSNIYTSCRERKNTPAETWISWLECFVSDATQLRLTGGEPTLHPEFFTILDAATSFDAYVTLFTNGRWQRPRELVSRLKHNKRLSGMLISLHGSSKNVHEQFTRRAGSFQQTIENIQIAIDSGIRVALSTVITQYNWDSIDEIAALGKSLGVEHIAFNRYIGNQDTDFQATLEQINNAIKKIDRLIQIGEKVKYGIGIPQCHAANASDGCLAGVAYVSIDPWGNVHPCSHSPTIIGSLYESSFYDLWNSPKMDEWRSLMPAPCTSCAAYSVCHGGCRAIQELRKDERDPLRGDPLTTYTPYHTKKQLPASVRPRANVRLRPESFGYAVLGAGQVLPVRAEALPIIQACTGNLTFGELVEHFGADSLNLLGDLWEKGMIESV